MPDNEEDLARSYYRALDSSDYDELETLLSPEFTQYRPDTTLDAQDFVEFMRNDRPVKDTDHEIDGVYHGPDGAAVVGRVTKEDRELFGFVDVFRFDVESGQIKELTTYSR